MRQRHIEIVPSRPTDIDFIVVIERSAHKSPWDRQIFVEELERKWAYLDVICERLDDGKSHVVGFCNYWLVADEVHLLNIATAVEHHRRGHGRRLMEHLVAFARLHSCRYITLEVRRSNEPAIALYESMRFEAVGIRPRYYVEDREDAVVMTLDLAPA